MKTRLLIIIMLITILSLNLQSEKVCDLNEVMKLEQLIIDNDYAYLAEEFKIHIYSIKTKKLISSFGKKGEDPGEFPYKRNIIIGKNTISIDSQNKILFFSKEGKFVKELRKDPNCNKLIPVKENYVGVKLDFSKKNINKVLVYNIYNNNFKKIKAIGNNTYIGKLLKRILKSKKYDDYIPRIQKSFLVYKDNIYISDPNKGIFFEVFNHKGKLIRTISEDFKKENITTKFKNHYINELKNRKNWEQIKARRNIIFRKVFPVFKWFSIYNEHIYLFTYNIEDDKRQCLIVNMDGKIIKTIRVRDVREGLLTVKNGFFYYTLENEEDEIWELHRQKIFE